MNKRQSKNPFKPTAGMNPPELVGRSLILDDFAEALDNGPGAPERLLRISGVRGTGKTVLLNAVGKIARDRGFTVVDVASNTGFCERIQEVLMGGRTLQNATLEPSVLGISLGSLAFSPSKLSLFEIMKEAARKNGLLITLDEVQDANTEELRALGNDIQLLIRQDCNIAFAFAGLPTSVDGVVGTEALTFLQRAQHIELSRLEEADVEASFLDTVTQAGMGISPEVAGFMAESVQGYPFMLQLVGYYTWQAASRRQSDGIEAADAQAGIQKARSHFNSMVIEPVLRRLPERQFEYLMAMARCAEGPVSSGEVAARMNLGTKDVGSYRKRLIEAGVIESVRFGKVEFSVPYMREYLRELDGEE